MKIDARSLCYLAAILALLAVAAIVPGAWAESLQKRLGQTVPTPTPTRPFVPTVEPTAVVPTAVPPTAVVPTQRPGDTPVPPADTPVPPTETVPGATVVVTATIAPTSALARPAGDPLTLVKEVSHTNIWPGVSLTFTLTLTNTSTGSVRQVRLEDVLPGGLEPGAIQGAVARWEGRTLRAERAVLPPGGRLAVTFAARVADDVPAGGVIVNQAVATAGASGRPSVRVTASALMALPPLELPPAGGLSGCGGVR